MFFHFQNYLQVNKAASSDKVQRTQPKDDNFRQGMSEEQMQFLERRKKMRNMRRESEGSQQFNYKFTDPFTSAPPLGIFEKVSSRLVFDIKSLAFGGAFICIFKVLNDLYPGFFSTFSAKRHKHLSGNLS